MKAILKIYKQLKKKYGSPEGQWSLWCKRPKTIKEKEEVVIGAILTQRANWKNVELAIKNLRRAKVLSIKKIYQTGKKNIKRLEKLIRPSGFYKQKAKRLFGLCKFFVENYGSLEKFFKQDLETCRNELLGIFGVGPETADSILLYAGNKPTFVIDEYTKRLIKKYHFTKNYSYHFLQNLFEENLPKDYCLYQDFHALIVIEGKNSSVH